jgi:hypothetical protein
VPSQQCRGRTRRRTEQILVSECSLRIEDRCLSAVALGVDEKAISVETADHVPTLRLLRGRVHLSEILF